MEELQLVLIVRVQELLDDSISCFEPLKIVDNSILESHRLLLFQLIALHKLVNFDALEGAHLAEVLLKSCITSTDPYHYLIGLNQKNGRLCSNHVLAPIVLI